MNTTGKSGASLINNSAARLMGTCGVVATAAFLGADWLKSPLLGLPTGIWLIGAVQIGSWMAQRRAFSGAVSRRFSSLLSGDVGMYLGRGAGAGWEALRSAAGTLHVSPARFIEIEECFSARAERAMRTSRPLRIGLDCGPELRQLISSQSTSLDVEWVTLSPAPNDQETLRRFRLDAVVHQPSAGPIRISTLEHPEREASWYDWATPRPLTYASVFPVRVDPTQVTVDEFNTLDSSQAPLLAAIIRAAAALSRSPGRLRLSDRLSGRLPAAGGAFGSGVRTPTGPADRAMLELVERLSDPSTVSTPASRAAARAVSAWLASTEAWLDIDLRKRGIEAALRLNSGEVEMSLRAAAIRFAVCDDEAAYSALRSAEEVIRSSSHTQIGEHLAFLQGELELGLPNPLTLGRVAAGICLVCASSPRERVAYIRGDIMDDVRHSAWLVGRDQDRVVLSEVFKQMGADQSSSGPWEMRDAA